jgi:hypothetical protein
MLTGVMPWESEYVQIVGMSPPFPRRPYSDVILTCRARTQTRWFSNEEVLTNLEWTAEFRDADQITLAQITSNQLDHKASFRHGSSVLRHDHPLVERTIVDWLATAFPAEEYVFGGAHALCLEGSARGILSQIQSWMDMPELTMSELGLRIEVSDTPLAQLFPGIHGAIGTIKARPMVSSVTLVLGAAFVPWMGGALVALVIARRVLRRQIAAVFGHQPTGRWDRG